MARSSPSRGVARFEGFELDLESGELRRDGAPLKLQPQPAKVLVILVSHAGEIVSRNDLAEQVWGSETFVDFEQGLNFAIRQIRSALGDDADQPRFLETLPKRGYRFIAAIEQAAIPEAEAEKIAELPSPRSSRFWVSATAIAVVLTISVLLIAWRHSSRKVPSGPLVLAVLPFDDLSGGPQEYLVDGLTEEMIAQVTRLSPDNLRVIARTSAMQYKHTKKSAHEIGQELAADYILENSIRHEGNRIRITTQLVRTADQTHIWAETYNRDAGESLTMESEVTEEIAEQIQRHLLPKVAVSHPPEAHSVSPEAHELYLKGRYYFNQRSRAGLLKSIEYFNQATAKDPNYAAAYAGLADSYNLFGYYGFDPSQNSVSQAKISADKALQLDNTMAAAHASLAYTEFMWPGDWAAADRGFRRALELDDNYVPAHQWYALYLAAAGRVDEALMQMNAAQRLDPLSPAVHAGMGYIEYFARDYDEAIRQSRVALQLNSDFMVAHEVLGLAYVQQKKYPEAIGELQTAVNLAGGVPVYLCALGRAYALSGNIQEARSILRAVEAKTGEPQGTGSALAGLYLALGDSNQALFWLEQTAKGDIQANWLRVAPEFDALRNEPRFMAVLRRIGSKEQP